MIPAKSNQNFTVVCMHIDYMKIVNWRHHLKFPDEVKLSPGAKDLISKLLCNVEQRLGTQGAQEIKRNMFREATAFLLNVLKPSLPEHAFLQTKVLEINLLTYPNVADAKLANGIFSHYDCPCIAQLCEKTGLYVRALQRTLLTSSTNSTMHPILTS